MNYYMLQHHHRHGISNFQFKSQLNFSGFYEDDEVLDYAELLDALGVEFEYDHNEWIEFILLDPFEEVAEFKQQSQMIAEAKDILKSAGYITHGMFVKEDIREMIQSMGIENFSEGDIDAIIFQIGESFDATIGINWDTIRETITIFQNNLNNNEKI